MFVEFTNITRGTAYYAVGDLDNLHAVPYMRDMVFTNCGNDSTVCLKNVTEVVDRLTEAEPGDIFQIRLFTTDPDTLIYTNRIKVHDIYWVSNEKQHFFEKMTTKN